MPKGIASPSASCIRTFRDASDVATMVIGAVPIDRNLACMFICYLVKRHALVALVGMLL